MNEKARKYIDLFRKVKIATTATVDEEGHPQARTINVMLAEVHYRRSAIYDRMESLPAMWSVRKGLPGRCGKTPA